MGCWNQTCMLSNLHITAGQRVALFVMEKKDSHSNCYTNSFYQPTLIPFYGEYNDYGAAENCSGVGMNIMLDVVRSRLTEFEQGPNPYHDSPAEREDFGIDELFDLDHESRLFIDGKVDADWHKSWAKTRLVDGDLIAAAKAEAEFSSAVKLGQPLTVVMIHGDVYDHIINEWVQEEYISYGKYKHYKFADTLKDMPEYLAKLKEFISVEDEPDIIKRELAAFRRAMGRHGDLFEWNHPNLVAKWMRSGSDAYPLITNMEVLSDLLDAKVSDEVLTEVITEMMKGQWINAFMSCTRKAWVKPVGAGSQCSETEPYRLLCEATLKVIDAEDRECDRWDESDGEQLELDFDAPAEQNA